MICGGNGENGVYIDYMAHNAYFHVLFENPDSFFSRVTRYGFFKYYVLIKMAFANLMSATFFSNEIQNLSFLHEI